MFFYLNDAQLPAIDHYSRYPQIYTATETPVALPNANVLRTFTLGKSSGVYPKYTMPISLKAPPAYCTGP